MTIYEAIMINEQTQPHQENNTNNRNTTSSQVNHFFHSKEHSFDDYFASDDCCNNTLSRDTIFPTSCDDSGQIGEIADDQEEIEVGDVIESEELRAWNLYEYCLGSGGSGAKERNHSSPLRQNESSSPPTTPPLTRNNSSPLLLNKSRNSNSFNNNNNNNSNNSGSGSHSGGKISGIVRSVFSSTTSPSSILQNRKSITRSSSHVASLDSNSEESSSSSMNLSLQQTTNNSNSRSMNKMVASGNGDTVGEESNKNRVGGAAAAAVVVNNSQYEMIPLMFSHRIYRYHWRFNTYEMIADEYNITGWRHIYTAVQNGEEMIGVSDRSGCVYRKVLRTSLTKKVTEEDSYVIPSSSTDWNDTRVLLVYKDEMLFFKAKEVAKLDLNGYTFSVHSRNSIGNWKKNVFTMLQNKIYGVDLSSFDICCYNLDTHRLTHLNSSRDWTDTAGIVIYNGNLIMFTNNGMYRMDPNSGQYKLCARDDGWSLYSGCVAKVSDHTVLFISSGNLYLWDLVSNKYKLLSRSWKICNCIATVKAVDIRDRNFLKTGSSLKGE